MGASEKTPLRLLEAIDSLLAIGPGAELIRLNGEYGENRRGEIAEALRTITPPGISPSAP
jgi:hypothetical protein